MVKKDKRICKICGKNLRPLLSTEDWDSRSYHVVCFNQIIKDLNNFNKVAYTKYNYKKKIANMTEEQARLHVKANKPFVITFD